MTGEATEADEDLIPDIDDTPPTAPAASAKQKRGGVKVHKRTVMVDGKPVPMPDAEQTKVGKYSAAVRVALLLLSFTVSGCKLCCAASQVDQRPMITFYTAPMCSDCAKVYRDVQSGYFNMLNCQWQVHDIKKYGKPKDWTADCTVPAVRVNDGPLIVVSPYSGQQLGNNIRDQLAGKPVTSAIARQPKDDRPEPPRTLPEPDPKFSPIADPNWEGIRILILGDVSTPIEFLSGPMSRLIRGVTGDKAQIEIITRTEHPKKFGAVVEAAGVALDLSPLQVVVVADRMVDVGLFKSIALKRIEGELASKAQKLGMPLPIDVIFERIHKKSFAAVIEALAVQESPKPAGADRKTIGKPSATAIKVVEAITGDTKHSNAISFLCWAFSIAVGKLGSQGSRFASEHNRHLDERPLA